MAMAEEKLAEFKERATHDCQYVCLLPEELGELVDEVTRFKTENEALKEKNSHLEDALHLLHVGDDECECDWCKTKEPE